MFYIGGTLGITGYFVYAKLVEAKRQLKVTRAPTKVIKKLNFRLNLD